MGAPARRRLVAGYVDAALKAADTDSITDPRYAKLRDLKKLLDSGVITQAEFDREKEKILSEP